MHGDKCRYGTCKRVIYGMRDRCRINGSLTTCLGLTLGRRILTKRYAIPFMCVRTFKTRYTKNMRQKGFTLIELVVVVAIIALLAAMVIIGLSRQQAKTRDAKRISDLSTIHTALESYIVDNLDPPLTTAATYPNQDDANYDYSSQTAGSVVTDPEFMTFLSSGGYLDAPKDPINNNPGALWPTFSTGYSYLYHYGARIIDGVWFYVIGAKLEVDSPPALPSGVSNVHPQLMWIEFPVRLR